MKHRFSVFRLVCGVVLLVCSLAVCVWGFLAWVGYFDSAPMVGCVYGSAESSRFSLDALRSGLEDADITFAAEPAGSGPVDAAIGLIERGARAIVLDLDEAPADYVLLRAARANGVSLIFTGASPGRKYLSNYDKAYYIGSSRLYGGELSGGDVAAAYRDGTLADADGDHLLDYLALCDGTEAAQEVLDALLRECEHYGVYSSNLLPALPDDPDAAQSDGASDESLAESTPEASPASELALARWAELDEVPEVILSVGFSNAEAAFRFAEENGWLSPDDRQLLFAAVVENKAEAQALAETGLYCSIVYYDTDATAAALLQMLKNTVKLRYAADGTGLNTDDGSEFLIPYVAF